MSLAINLVQTALGGVKPPCVAIVLGSGFSGLADMVEPEIVIPYEALGGYRGLVSIPGHTDELVIGGLAGVRVAVFNGRVHLYQGVSARDAAWPARLAAGLGCDTLLVTNASGAVSPHIRAGQIILIADHVNLMGTNPLSGWADLSDGRFVSMRDAYDAKLRRMAHRAAASEEIDLIEGVYAAVAGPSYETSAEVAALRAIGVDVVGMSTVPEVIVARALNMRVLGLSLVTNVAAEVGHNHNAVLAVGDDVADRLARLVIAILRTL